MAAVKALQQWCKIQCEGYRDVCITNMTTSFRDGLAFCALIHKHRPDLIDFDSLQKENVYDNNHLAFRVAEEQLSIPALLDAEDMVSLKVPDRLSILTYVSQYYNYFHGRSPIGGVAGVKRPAEDPVSDVSGGKNAAVTGRTFTTPKILTKTEKDVPVVRVDKSSSLNRSCSVCKKHVHLVQRHLVDGKLYHRNCFKCSECSNILLSGTYKPGKETNTFICKSHQITQKAPPTPSTPPTPATPSVHYTPTPPIITKSPPTPKDVTLRSVGKDSTHKISLWGLRKNGASPPPTSTNTSTPVSKSTPPPTSTPVSKSTSTPPPTSTTTPTPVSKSTPPPTSTPVSKSTSTPTTTPVSKSTPPPTSTPTTTPVSKSTPPPTSTPVSKSTPPPTSTPVSKSTPTPVSKSTPPPTSTPVSKSTPTPVSKSTPPPTSTPVSKSTPPPTSTPTPVSKSTPTPVSRATPTPTATPSLTVVPRYKPAALNPVTVKTPSERRLLTEASDWASTSVLRTLEARQRFFEPAGAGAQGGGVPSLGENARAGGVSNTSPRVDDWRKAEKKEKENANEKEKAKSLISKFVSVEASKTSVSSPSTGPRPNLTSNADSSSRRRLKPPQMDLDLSPTKPTSWIHSSRTASTQPSDTKAEFGTAPSDWRSLLKPVTKNTKSSTTQNSAPIGEVKTCNAGSRPWDSHTKISSASSPASSTNISSSTTSSWSRVQDTTGPGDALKDKNTESSSSSFPSSAASTPKPQKPDYIPREEIMRELKEIEENLNELQKEGVDLEKQLRQCEEEEQEDVLTNDLMVDWFSLIRKKQVYIRRESELVYVGRSQDLEEEQPNVEAELRKLIDTPERLKTLKDKKREEELMAKLVEIVNDRNAIVDGLDEDRLREEEEDEQLNKMMQNLDVRKEKKKKSSVSSLFRRKIKRDVSESS